MCIPQGFGMKTLPLVPFLHRSNVLGLEASPQTESYIDISFAAALLCLMSSVEELGSQSTVISPCSGQEERH